MNRREMLAEIVEEVHQCQPEELDAFSLIGRAIDNRGPKEVVRLLEYANTYGISNETISLALETIKAEEDAGHQG